MTDRLGRSETLHGLSNLPPEQMTAHSGVVVGGRWCYWQCATCGRVVSYPPSPVGPGAPRCDWNHPTSQPMIQVEVKPTPPKPLVGTDDREHTPRGRA